jgi:NADH-quinone oxidoreductase subunit F
LIISEIEQVRRTFVGPNHHGATVFEALPVGGGMLSVAIPEFRLPKRIIQKEIDYIAKRGVEIRYNTPINVNFTVEDLKKQGYEAMKEKVMTEVRKNLPPRIPA